MGKEGTRRGRVVAGFVVLLALGAMAVLLIPAFAPAQAEAPDTGLTEARPLATRPANCTGVIIAPAWESGINPTRWYVCQSATFEEIQAAAEGFFVNPAISPFRNFYPEGTIIRIQGVCRWPPPYPPS